MEKKYRLLFIQASLYKRNRPDEIVKQKKVLLPGLVFPLLAAMTPDYYDVQLKLEMYEDIDFDADVDLVGIGVMGTTILRGIEIAREFRKRGKIVFMGGYQPSMTPEMALDDVDSIVIGDAEISYPKLLEDFEKKGKLDKIYHNPVDSLAGLPVPRYELLTEKKMSYMLPVMAARGCPHTCSFCSIYCIYRGKVLNRPVDEVIRDIRRVKELGYNRVFFVDDNIFGNPKFFHEFCERVTPLKIHWTSQCTINIARNPETLKKAAASGCKGLSFGLETISQEALEAMDKKWSASRREEMIKRVRDAGIVVYSSFLLGTDSDTEDSIRQTSEFIRKAKIGVPILNILTPMPGTDLYKDYKKKHKLMHEDLTQYTGSNCVHYPAKISPEKTNEMLSWLIRDVYSPGHIFSRIVLNRGFLINPLYYLFALIVNLYIMVQARSDDHSELF